jgi:hypothetical protein
VTPAGPGYDQVVVSCPDGARLCNSLGCARAGTLAEVIATYGVLNDPGASYHHRGALWRECWGQSYPLCGACWHSARQIAEKYRPGLLVIDATGRAVAAESSGGRA